MVTESSPPLTGVTVVEVGAFMAAPYATMQLRERDGSGEGQFIDVSLFESGVSFAVWEAGMYFADGTVPGRHGSAHQSNAPYQAVRTADGHVTIGANTPKTWTGLCHALGLDHLLTAPRYGDAYSRLSHREDLIKTIERVTAARSSASIIEALNEAGVPCAPIAGYDEVFTDETLRQRDFFWDAPHATLGSVRQLGSPMRFSRTPVRRGKAGPLLGDSTDRILAEIGNPQDIPARQEVRS